MGDWQGGGITAAGGGGGAAAAGWTGALQVFRGEIQLGWSTGWG